MKILFNCYEELHIPESEYAIYKLDALWDFQNWIEYVTSGTEREKYLKMFHENFPTYNKIQSFLKTDKNELTFIFFLLKENINSIKINENIWKLVNKFFPELQVDKNQKITRVIRNYCLAIGLDTNEQFERKLVQVGLALNQNKFTYIRIIEHGEE